MKKYLLPIAALFLALNSLAQYTFEHVYDEVYYQNCEPRDVFTQEDGYLMPFWSRHSYDDYLSIIKTDLQGDTLWTKEHYLNPSSGIGSGYANSDEEGNIYFACFPKLIKLDPEGNIIWEKDYFVYMNDLIVKDDTLWMISESIPIWEPGLYLYKIDPSTGDSLWRSERFASGSEPTSIVVPDNGEVIVTANYSTIESHFYKLPLGSDTFVEIEVNAPDGLMVVDSKSVGNEIYSIGRLEPLTTQTNQAFFMKYASDGTITSIRDAIFPYPVYLLNCTVNNNDEIIAAGCAYYIEGSTMFKPLITAMTLDSGLLWTQVFDALNGDVYCWDIKQATDGGYIVGGEYVSGNRAYPYLLKTDSSGIVGLNQMNNNNVFSIYPNPAGKEITITTPGMNQGQVSIIDLSGTICCGTMISSEITRLNTENLKPGLYIVRIITKTDLQSSKLIISR